MTSSFLLNEDRDAIHKRRVEEAIIRARRSDITQESNWHDFKRDIGSGIDTLCKDFVALANTTEGPYGNDRYIIIGVTNNTAEVVGISTTDPNFTPDKRTLQISQTVRRNIAPYLDISVINHEFEGKTVQILIVPQTPGSWHMVIGDKDSGFWIRRSTGSQRPSYQDFEQHQLQLIQREVKPLVDRLASLEYRLGEQRDQILALEQIRAPQNESAAHLTKRLFATPEHALLVKIRDELQVFRDQHIQIVANIKRFDPENLTSIGTAQMAQTTDTVREFFERVEEATRPIIETLAVLIHHGKSDDLTQIAVREIADVLINRAQTQVNASLGIEAMLSYHVQLVLYGAAIASFHAPNLKLFGILMNRGRTSTTSNGKQSRRPLASLLNLREPLDVLAVLIGESDHYCAAVTRMQRRLLQRDWIGATLPLLDQSQTFSQAEALLTLSYVAAAQSTGITQFSSEFASPIPAWWHYLEANETLKSALNHLKSSKTAHYILGFGDLYKLLESFYAMKRPSGTLLTVTVEDLLPPPGRLSR